MTEDASGREAPTRRDAIKYGGMIVTTGLLAGCAGESDAGSEPTPETSGMEPATDTESETPTPTETGTETVTPGDTGYSVTMSPMGTVEFESVPQSVYTGLPNTTDMAVAAGQSDAINSVYFPESHGTLLNNFYERLPGVSLDWEGLTDSWGLGTEGFFELDSDVHLTDPIYATTLKNLDEQSVETIGQEIGPWFGNYYSDRHRTPPESAAAYEHYSLWEINDRVARVFRAGKRGTALREVYSSMRSVFQERLPPKSERPSVALSFKGQGKSFWIYKLNADGFLTAHTRPLGATDAFGDLQFDGAQKKIDYEAMLEADPDVILVLFTMASSHSISDIRDGLESDAVASKISAVKNGRVHAQGARYQGPLMNLFQLEMTAKQLYPDHFGEWPGYVDGKPYPEVPEDEQLFDRQRVADTVNGEI